jgi:hypothetical protein
MADNVFFDSNTPDVVEDVNIDVSSLTTAEIIPASSVLLRMIIQGTTFQKQVATGEVVDKDKDIDVRMVTTTKRMIDKKYVSEIQSLDGAMRSDLRRIGLQPKFLGTGNVVIPLSLVNYTMARINEYKAKREKLIDNLISSYEQAKQDARERSPDLYSEMDYPSVDDIRQMFQVSTNFYSVSLPEVLESVNETVYRETAELRRQQLSEAVDEIRLGLRAGMLELVTDLEGRVKSVGTEKQKRFTSGFTHEMKIFLDTFDGKNSIAGDTELADMVNKARAVLDGVSPESIKNNVEVQVAIERTLGEIRQNLSEMVETRTRKASFV